MTDKIFYNDPQKEEKLKKAIELGFIDHQKDQDGVSKYTLTQKGVQQWSKEKMMGMAQSFTFKFF